MSSEGEFFEFGRSVRGLRDGEEESGERERDGTKHGATIGENRAATEVVLRDRPASARRDAE